MIQLLAFGLVLFPNFCHKTSIFIVPFHLVGVICCRHSWNEPKRVQGLGNVKVRAGFASGVISVAVGDDGSMWTWGRSKRGQLGLGKGVVEAAAPTRVEVLAGEEIAKVVTLMSQG